VKYAAALLLTLCLFPVSDAVAGPDGGNAPGPSGRDPDQIIQRRREMKEAYEEMRANRRKALAASAALAAGGTDRVPGWRDEASGRIASDPGPARSAADAPAPDAPGSSLKAQLPLLALAAVLLTFLFVRVFLPHWFASRLRADRRSATGGARGPAGRKGAMTVKLRPRNERIGRGPGSE
jgi:hypothetical protein